MICLSAMWALLTELAVATFKSRVVCHLDSLFSSIDEMLLRVNYPKSVTTHKVAADRYSAFVANMTEDPTVKSADKQDRETEDDYEDSPLKTEIA